MLSPAMKKTLLPLLFVAFLFGCSSEPDHFIPRGENATIQPIDKSRLVVIEDIRFNCASNGYFFPAGTYLPIKKDNDGVYYQSPTGIRVRVGITFFESTPYGGIYVKREAKYGTYSYLVWYDRTEIRKYDTPIGEMEGSDPNDVFLLSE
jgi:hypothetical protein